MDNVRLPDDVERGARGGPGFKTTIVTLSSGAEQRNQEWSIARGAWDVGYGIRKRVDLEAVYAFFLARRGMARSFRFKDWLDFQATAEAVATTGNALTRQLQKTYEDDVNPYIRKIVAPVASTLQVYVDNILVESGYTLGDNGLLTFSSDPGSNVKASFEFDVPARFDTDELGVTLNTYLDGDIASIPIVEVR